MAQPLVKKDDDRDDEVEYSPFLGIEKGAVLQEARVFNDPQLDARRCSQVITKLLYLLNQGETFTKVEATEVFFAVTKLFQSKDNGLRRMVYLMIKEISPSADEVIIVTSSLMKDINSRTDMYRANAIRVLCRITDGTLLTQIERYLKQAIVDKNPVVASAALASGIHLLQTTPEIVKRWSNEVQEAVQSRAALVQFHALALLHQIRQNDRLAVSKLVTSLTKGTVRSPLAQCLLIRYTTQVIRETGVNTQTGDRPFYDYLEGCLRHKAEMIILEAARAITELSNVTTRELTPAITVLQLFLSSSKPVLRFAAVRTLNKVAMTHPMAVTNCNIDMESLISDQNRSIATLAITTLLKTGNESSVERLMKQITTFMSDIADEFKIVVVDAIRSLCLKFPLKYRSLMNFLSNILREEGGFEYKKSIVDSIVILIRDIPDAKESGLLHLCEFIEDCEFTYLSTQILHFLGNEGPKTSDPGKYIRYIYNRVILENATVRASAVSTLAKFGAMVDSLKPRIFVLLKRCLFDNDDEKGMLVFDTAQFDGILKKISEFNNTMLSDPASIHLKLNEGDIQRLNAIVKILKDTSHYHSRRFADVDIALLLKLLKTWPLDILFPAIDVVRMIVLHPDGATKIIQQSQDGNDVIVELIKKVTSSPLPSTLLTSLRAVTNLFRSSYHKEWLQIHRAEILDAFSSCWLSANKNVQLSYATLLLNYSVLLIEMKDEVGQSQVLSAALEMAEEETVDSDSRFRALVAIGSLMLEGLVKKVALDFDVVSVARAAKAFKETKIAEVGADIESVARQG